MRVLLREYNRHVCVETDNVMTVHFVPLRKSETMSITGKDRDHINLVIIYKE